MDDRPTYFEDFCPSPFHMDRRSQDDFLRLSSMQSQLQSPEVQFFRPDDPVNAQVAEDPEVEKRHLMHCQGDKEDDLQGFIYGWTNGLSLTLGSHLLTNTVVPCNYESMKEQVSCSNHEIIREDLKEFNCQRNRPSKVEHRISEGESSANCAANNSDGASQNLASMTAVLQQSKYLKPAQELLDEVVYVRNAADPSSDEELRKVRSVGLIGRIGSRSLQVGERINCEGNAQMGSCYSSEDKHDVDIRVAKLVALLEEVQ